VDELRELVSRYAEEYNIDEELIRAVIQVESGWKPDAVSSKGAQGLMQLMPRTAAMLGVEDAFDPEENIGGGVKYLARLTDKYDGDVEMALAAYNAGPARVDAAGGAPFSETARYVRNVMALYHRYREES
jgi:soluble lytic murein transglycosylase-like protein